jgi:hypothetical protein
MTHWRSVSVVALLYTLLNAVKPLHIDDGAYVVYAHQDAAHPLDPYGFAMFWWYNPEPANHVLAPPVLPYWWALGIRLFGERVWLWKLWLLPFSALLAFGLLSLYRRFARGLESPLLWMTMLSPAFLPSFNLMLDIPMLALSLAAVLLFIRARDRNSLVLAALAGLTAALAIETKYTGLLAPATMLLYAALFGGLRLAALALLVTVHAFVAWELLIAMLYDESHFLLAVRGSGALLHKLDLGGPLLTVMGAVGWPVLLLAFAALGAGRRAIALSALIGLAGYTLVAVLGDTFRSAWAECLLCQRVSMVIAEPFEPEHVLYGVSGALLGAGLAWVAWRLCRMPSGARWPWRHRPIPRVECFLVLWLGLEVVGYFGMTPFPAVRRVLGILIVATLLAGRLASRSCRRPDRRRIIHAIALYSALLGLGFYLLDLREAFAIREAAETAAQWAQQRGSGTVWYLGHWSFQFYGERAGMRPVVPKYGPGEAVGVGRRGIIPLPAPSRLRKGDWLVVPDEGIPAQSIDYTGTEPVVELFWDDWLPLRTVMGFYAGSKPLEHRPRTRPRRAVEIRRVTLDYVP